MAVCDVRSAWNGSGGSVAVGRQLSVVRSRLCLLSYFFPSAFRSKIDFQPAVAKQMSVRVLLLL